MIWPALPDSTTTCTNITCPQCFSPSGQAVSCPSLGSCVPLSSLPQYSVTLPPCELPNPTVNCNYPYGGGPDASFSSDASLANDADSSNEASLASDADSSSDASLANDADSSNDATGGNDGGSNDVPAKTDCGASGTGGSTAECSYTPVVSDHPDCLDTVLTYTMCAKGFGSPWGCISPEYDVPGCCLPCGQCGLALTGAPFQPDGCHSYEQLAAFARAYYDPSPDPPSYGTFQVTGVPNGNGNDCYYRAP